jgi:ATP-dependent DNA helicase PIF1
MYNNLSILSVVACRTQLPLMLAYAITIHKSQGMTIPLLEVSFAGIFEYGQVSHTACY